jgi:hypothetical protein
MGWEAREAIMKILAYLCYTCASAFLIPGAILPEDMAPQWGYPGVHGLAGTQSGPAPLHLVQRPNPEVLADSPNPCSQFGSCVHDKVVSADDGCAPIVELCENPVSPEVTTAYGWVTDVTEDPTTPGQKTITITLDPPLKRPIDGKAIVKQTRTTVPGVDGHKVPYRSSVEICYDGPSYVEGCAARECSNLPACR